jgi:hypothetical protein
MSIFQGNVDITSTRMVFELEKGVPEAFTSGFEEDCTISFTFMVMIYPVQTMRIWSVDSEPGAKRRVEQAWALARSGYDNEDDEKERCGL